MVAAAAAAAAAAVAAAAAWAAAAEVAAAGGGGGGDGGDGGDGSGSGGGAVRRRPSGRGRRRGGRTWGRQRRGGYWSKPPGRAGPGLQADGVPGPTRMLVKRGCWSNERLRAATSAAACAAPPRCARGVRARAPAVRAPARGQRRARVRASACGVARQRSGTWAAERAAPGRCARVCAVRFLRASKELEGISSGARAPWGRKRAPRPTSKRQQSQLGQKPVTFETAAPKAEVRGGPRYGLPSRGGKGWPDARCVPAVCGCGCVEVCVCVVCVWCVWRCGGVWR